MFNYIKSEVIKTKRISIRKLTVFIPLISIFLAVTFNWLGGKETFSICYLNNCKTIGV